VGDTTGTVSTIHIRSTIVVDADNREMLIPNREFITARVTNWTLSNTETRVVVRVGVAYGTDLELAERLLLEAARRTTHTLRDPAPMVIIEGFGDNAVNLALFARVAEMAHRLETMNAL